MTPVGPGLGEPESCTAVQLLCTVRHDYCAQLQTVRVERETKPHLSKGPWARAPRAAQLQTVIQERFTAVGLGGLDPQFKYNIFRCERRARGIAARALDIMQARQKLCFRDIREINDSHVLVYTVTQEDGC